jgi:hypothetical protein
MYMTPSRVKNKVKKAPKKAKIEEEEATETIPIDKLNSKVKLLDKNDRVVSDTMMQGIYSILTIS